MRVMNIGKNRNIMDRIKSAPQIMRIRRNRRNRMIIPMLIGVGIGALVGFGAAMMVAPRSGRMTRMMLAERGNDIAYRAKQISGQAKSRIQSSVRRPTKGVFERNDGNTPMEMKRDVNILESDIDKTYDL